MTRGVIQKANLILDLFSLERPEWGVSEAARSLGIPKSTVSELVVSLAEGGMLRRTSKGRYRLGWRLFELGQTSLNNTEFRTEARQAMLDLVEKQEVIAAHLAVLDGTKIVYLEKVQPTPAVKISCSDVGGRLAANCTSVGKVLLAHQDWEALAEQFGANGLTGLTRNSITDLDQLADELAQVREQGYAYDREEKTAGLCCIGAPIRDHTGEVVAALSASMPAYCFPKFREDYTAAVVEATRGISQSIEQGAIEAPIGYVDTAVRSKETMVLGEAV